MCEFEQTNLNQEENQKSSKNFFKSKKWLLLFFAFIVIILAIIISIIGTNKTKTENNAIKENISVSLSGKRFSAIEGLELYIVNVNDNGEFSTEAYKLSADAKRIEARLWSDNDYSDLYYDLAITVLSKNKYYTAIGYPVFENDEIVGLKELLFEDYNEIEGETAYAIDYNLITTEHEKMIKTYLEKDKTKVELNELLPTCKDFLNKSINKGYITAESKTDYSKNNIDITINKSSSSAFTMRLNITYPNAQTPYSDEKITGIKITNISSSSLPNYDLPKYIIPYLEVFPNALFKEKDLIKIIKDKGKITSEIITAPKANYYDNITTYTTNGITYTYNEQIITTDSSPFYKSLEITIDTDHAIFLADYPEYHIAK